MDETGHSGDTGSADGGSGGESRDRTLLNGWPTSDGPWSNAGSALDPEEDVPAWRRPPAEIRPFARSPLTPEQPSGDIRQPSGEIRPFADPGRSGFDDPHRTGEVRPSGGSSRSDDVRVPDRPNRSGEVRPLAVPRAENPVPAWSAGRARYSDLLAHLSPNGNGSARPAAPEPSLQPGPVPTGPPQSDSHPDPFGPDPLQPGSVRPGLLRPDTPGFPPRTDLGGFPSRTEASGFPPQTDGSAFPLRTDKPGFPSRPDTLQADDQRRTSELRAVEAPPPSSAPPYPYEGDLDDAARRDGNRPPIVQQRAAVPLSRPFPEVRPATPDVRRVDWNTAESARHALDPNTPAEGALRMSAPTPPEETPPATEPGVTRTSYDPSTFPRRLPYERAAPAGPAPQPDTSGYVQPPAYAGLPGRSVGDPGSGPSERSRALPQRVPAEPDVPTVPEPPPVEPAAETPALARIATHLRRGDVPSAQERQEGFDVKAILAAVKEVDGVRDASLRATPAGAHSLRLDLAEGADPAEVSRQVARLLQDRMGLDAAMQGGEAPPGASARAPAGGGRLPQNPQAGRFATDTVTGRPEVNGPSAPTLPARASVAPAQGTASVATPTTGPAAIGGLSSTVDSLPTSIDCGPARPLEIGEAPGPRVVIENVQVNTFGTEATVEVRLAVGGLTTAGIATGPAVDGYLLRLCAMATAQAVDELLSTSDHADGPARCYVEHAASVPFGPMQVAVVVLLLSCGGWVEQLAGSAVVTGDDRHAMVRATLAAVNRRLEALLS